MLILTTTAYAPLDLLTGWLHAVATYNPATGTFTDHFNGTVNNTGIGTLYNVTVTDTPHNGTPQTFNLGTLAGGQSATFSGTFTTTESASTVTE